MTSLHAIHLRRTLSLILTFLVAYAWCPLTRTAEAETVYLEIQSAKLRSEPKAWAAPTADIQYGDHLTVIETQNSWLKVRTAQDKEGFIPITATTPRQVVLKSTASPTGTIGSFEAVLAGKGFGSEVADSFGKKREDVNYSLVDEMRKHSKISDAEIYTFMEKGGLNVTGLK